jgi:hypothetical protein
VRTPPRVANVELGWEQEIYRRAREPTAVEAAKELATLFFPPFRVATLVKHAA